MPIFHNTTEAEYNAMPGLRISTVRAVMQNPARYKHERDNPSTEKHFTLGSAVHSLLLEDGKTVVHVPVNDWKTVKAREQRDAALADGKYPLNNSELRPGPRPWPSRSARTPPSPGTSRPGTPRSRSPASTPTPGPR